MSRSKQKHVSIWNIFYALGGIFVLGSIVLIILFFRGVTLSLEAENRSWATVSTCLIIEEYITQNNSHQWPRSWDDLADIVHTEHQPTWPNDREFYELNVAIDFNATLEEVAQMTPEDFSAIKPVGPYNLHAEMYYHKVIEAAQSVVDSE